MKEREKERDRKKDRNKDRQTNLEIVRENHVVTCNSTQSLVNEIERNGKKNERTKERKKYIKEMKSRKKERHTHTRTRTYTHTRHKHTYAHTHHTHGTHTHARTHTHTHTDIFPVLHLFFLVVNAL